MGALAYACASQLASIFSYTFIVVWLLCKWAVPVVAQFLDLGCHARTLGNISQVEIKGDCSQFACAWPFD